MADQEAALAEHRKELRSRLTQIVLYVVIGFGLSWICYEPVVGFALRPVQTTFQRAGQESMEWPLPTGTKKEVQKPRPEQGNLRAPLGFRLQVTLVVGIMVAFPFLLYQIWAFIAPAFRPSERRALVSLILASFLLFLGGLAGGFFLLPRAWLSLLQWRLLEGTYRPQLPAYLQLLLRTMLGWGLAFQVPIAMQLLVHLELASYPSLVLKRPHVILLSSILAGIGTPTQDPFNLILTALPPILLYELGLWMVWIEECWAGASGSDREKASLPVPVRLQESPREDPQVPIEVVANRPQALYRCGEQALFFLTVTQKGIVLPQGGLDYTLSLDGGRIIDRGVCPLRRGRGELRGTLDEPGILRATVFYLQGSETLAGLGAAAFEPQQIRPAAEEPGDFRTFWEAQLRTLAEVPMDVRLVERLDLGNERYAVFKISLATINQRRVYGWLGIPRGRGPFPAILNLPWGGVYPPPPQLVHWAQYGFLAIAPNTHEYDVDRPKEEYERLAQTSLKDYPFFQGPADRETFYFRQVILGCVRAVDYITSRPDWDHRTMIVNGSCQGGGLAIVTAGLTPQVTAVAANVPGLCDHHGAEVGRSSGWPQLLRESDAEQGRVAAYFDAVNFARHVTCPVLMGVGLVDTTCPPSGIYATYNVLKGTKQIVATPRMGHDRSPEYRKQLYRWILSQAGRGETLEAATQDPH